ncbi:transposase [Microbacterium hominis]|uniref:transposase n=1 Tax=Microbacterium hominis TaxID=162426 RepID=UPI001965FAA1|nr:transposase [Microbacterium hominis]QRY40827.1 transposase [Microbacterium hominis]
MSNRTRTAARGGPSALPPSGKPPYSESFKAGALALVDAGHPIAQVARDLGVARNTLRSWSESRLTASETSTSRAALIVTAASSGSRLAVLIALRDELAAKIAGGVSARDLTLNARLLDETMQKIDSLAASNEATQEQQRVEDGPWDPTLI